MRNDLLGASSFAVLCVPMVLASGSAFADPAVDGEKLLQDNCSRCHAIGKTGESPLPIAPRFRDVMRIYGAESLEEALGEGLVTGHADMPEFVFPPDQVGAIVAYLHTLEVAE